MKTRRISFAVSVLLIIQLFSFVNADAAWVDGKYISSLGACVIDYESGEVLYEYNGYVNRSPASMTKVMSLYCIFSEIEKRNISLDTVVPISSYVYNMPVTTDYQCIPLYYGTRYTVDELIGAVATYSAANALVALVEFISGTEAKFVRLMNDTAVSMGLNAWYYDCCGGYTNSISPVSMAKLARNIITDFPQIIERTRKPYIVFNGVKYYSTNKLYNTYYYEGADGLKTGTSSTAGCCFTGTAMRDGRRVISVTMYSASNADRFKDTTVLLDYGFRKLEEMYVPRFAYAHSRTFLNGYETPTLEYIHGDYSDPVFIVENLNNYGFDVYIDESENVLRATLNPTKELTPVSCDDYRGTYGVKFANVIDKGELRMILSDGVNEYEIKDFYASDGCHLVSVEEFAYKFSMLWDANSSTFYIDYQNFNRLYEW